MKRTKGLLLFLSLQKTLERTSHWKYKVTTPLLKETWLSTPSVYLLYIEDITLWWEDMNHEFHVRAVRTKWQFSKDFQLLSEDFHRLLWRPDECFRAFSKHCRTISEDYWRWKKTTKEGLTMFWSYTNKFKCSLKGTRKMLSNMSSSHVRISYHFYQFVTNYLVYHYLLYNKYPLESPLKPGFHMIVRFVPKNVQTIGTIVWKCYPDDRKRSKLTQSSRSSA